MEASWAGIGGRGQRAHGTQSSKASSFMPPASHRVIHPIPPSPLPILPVQQGKGTDRGIAREKERARHMLRPSMGFCIPSPLGDPPGCRSASEVSIAWGKSMRIGGRGQQHAAGSGTITAIYFVRTSDGQDARRMPARRVPQTRSPPRTPTTTPTGLQHRQATTEYLPLLILAQCRSLLTYVDIVRLATARALPPDRQLATQPSTPPTPPVDRSARLK
jgi:hypothetical protein